jgi:hydroxylamine reductase
MFCYQCQETSNGNGCTKVGVCGKDRKLAIELDVLIFETIELAALNHRLREYKQDDIMASRMITDALFVSITNANFDVDSVKNKIKMIREKKSP